MIAATFRPLPVWPHGTTPDTDRRGRWTFKAGWQDTLDFLDHELLNLEASNIVIGCGLREMDIRQDGWPRSTARAPEHPGVEVSFDHPTQGRLTYATDVCRFWEHNVRAIAYGLEALRAVDRHGISQRGQQYAGFKALTAGSGPSPERGARIVRERFGGDYREAVKALHPDGGAGDEPSFIDVVAAHEAGLA